MKRPNGKNMLQTNTRVIVLLLTIIFSSCGDEDGRQDTEQARISDADISDADISDAGISGVACLDKYQACSGACVDVSRDHKHCGRCGNACADDEICVAGSCEPRCGKSSILCSGDCVNVLRDPANCGGCGVACEQTDACNQGECAKKCGGGLTDCDGSCVALDSNREYCGSCNKVCAAGDVCDQGECAEKCSDSLGDCDGSCVDLDSDRNNCGECGTACLDGQWCNEGECDACVATLIEEIPAVVEVNTRDSIHTISGSCAESAAPESVFSFVAPSEGLYRFSTEGARFNTVLYALDGSCQGEELGCNDDAVGLASVLELDLKEEQTIMIVVDGYDGQAGESELSVSQVIQTDCCTATLERGCADFEVEECVCAIDDFCCETAWDEFCVEMVSSEECGSCTIEGQCVPADTADSVPAVLNGEIAPWVDNVNLSCGSTDIADVIFAFTAEESGTYMFDTKGSTLTDTVLAVFDGDQCDSIELDCNDDTAVSFFSELTIELEAEESVLVAVEGYEGEVGEVVVNVKAGSSSSGIEGGTCCEEDSGRSGCEVSEIETCVCDLDELCCDEETGWDEFCVDTAISDCGVQCGGGGTCSPVELTGALPVMVSGNTASGSDALSPSCAVFGDSNETIYEFIAPQKGRYQFDTSGSDVDTILQILDSDCDGIELACNDDPGDGRLSARLELNLVQDQVVLVNVDSFNGSGSAILSVSLLGSARTDCCVSHNIGGCDDSAVQSCVCALDAYCCDEEWDNLCVLMVTDESCGNCSF